jgi:hypothetical protein
VREQQQDDREQRFDAATGHWRSHLTQHQRDQLALTKAALRRRQAELARDDATLDRGDALGSREQTSIDRESAETGRRESSAASRPGDEPDETSR